MKTTKRNATKITKQDNYNLSNSTFFFMKFLSISMLKFLIINTYTKIFYENQRFKKL